MRFWCCWETLEEAKDGKCNMELVAGFGELDKTRFQEVLLEGLGTDGRLGLEGLMLTHVSQLIVWWIDYHLEGGGEVFCRVLRFPLR